MAHASEDANDKALWITLAQSWVRLAEHAAHRAPAAKLPPSPARLPCRMPWRYSQQIKTSNFRFAGVSLPAAACRKRTRRLSRSGMLIDRG
jgi:hypothetical protein